MRVRPRCGRLVGFSAGPENPHGVLAVTGGSRHALAMWYTRTRRHREDERMVADLYLHDSDAPGEQRFIAPPPGERGFTTPPPGERGFTATPRLLPGAAEWTAYV